MEEEWRDVPGFPGYRVSNHGRVLGARGAVLRPALTKGIYAHVALHNRHTDNQGRPIPGASGLVKRRDVRVSRLVAEVFVGPSPFAGAEVAHLDGNPRNNTPENLSWVTHRENESHKRQHGTVARGSRNGCAKLTESEVREIKRRTSGGESGESIAADYPVSASTISLIRRGKKWGWLDA